MDSDQLVYRLHFYNQLLFYEHVDAVAAVQVIALVDYGQRNLADTFDGSLRELEA